MQSHLEVLMSRVEKLSSGCWVWTGPTNKKGYGRIGIRVKRASRLAHRAAWLLMVGDIPPGIFVCHHCDNPPCCNPAHLFLGTNKENKEDSKRKGRTKCSDTAKEKLRIIRVGRKASAETRKKMSLMRKGEGNSMYGRTHTDEAKEKQRLKKLGRAQTPEHIAKRVAAMKRSRS